MKALVLAASLLAAASAHATTPIDETRPLQPTAKVSLDNVKGKVTVGVWDRPEIHIGGFLGDGVEGLQIKGDASKLHVEVDYPESRSWFGFGGGKAGESELVVKLPAGVELSIDVVSADVRVDGVAGRRLYIDGVSGDVTVDSSASDIEIDVVSGSITLQARSREVSLETVSGDIDLRGEVAGEITVESVSGSMRVENGAASRSVSAGVVSGDIELHTPLSSGAKLDAESLSGDLELVLPASTSARLMATSFTGKLRSDAGRVEKPEHGPGSSLETVLGSGDGEIVLETFSGDLTIRLK